MNKSDLPAFKDEVEYAVEEFIDGYDRQPTLMEFKELCEAAHAKVDEAREAYDEYKASGAFECVICDRTHHHHAPPSCCRAYNEGD